MVNEESAYYNPASIGLLHLDKTVSFVVPHSTKWHPELADDLRFKTWGASVGGSYRLIARSAPERFNISLGTAYNYARMHYGTFLRTNEHGDTLGLFESYDAVRCYAAAIGIDYYLHVGIGYAVKKIESKLSPQGAGAERGSGSAKADAHQYGVIVELPLNELLMEYPRPPDSLNGRIELRLTPSFAYVMDNVGDNISYVDAAQSDPLPKVRRMGVSILGAVAAGGKEYCSFRGSMEWEKLLVGNSPDLARGGLEIGILGAFFVRRGLLELDEVSDRLSTYGLGFRLRGLLNVVLHDNPASDDRGFGAYFARHFDLAVDYARYGSRDDNALSKTWFYAISMSL
jgi:hypothetical protein